MKRYTKKRLTGGAVCFALALLLVFAVSAQAAYKISDINSNVPIDGTVVQWTTEVEISWAKPTMAPGHTLMGYDYQWSTSEVPNWDGTELSVVPEMDPPGVTKPAIDFANDDSNLLRFLHVRTKYNDGGTVAYSQSVRIGPINIDNVAPTGTVRITDSEGNDITSTRNTQLNLVLSAAVAPTKMYLSETPSKPQAAMLFAPELVFDLSNTDPGEKTIHAWFEDAVGNTSVPATDTVILLGPVSITPDTAVIDLAVGTQVFRVEGTDEDYQWSFFDRSPEGVAEITEPTLANSITVTAAEKGTFRLQAVKGDETLTSGTITVVQSTVSKTFTLITTATTNTNTIGFIFENTGITTAHELGNAIGNCSQVSRWNAVTQSYSSHRMQFPGINNFILNIGEAYFVTVTTEQEFTLTGTPPASHLHNLITTATTNTNAIGVPVSKSAIVFAHDLGLDIGNCSQVSRWNAATQSYSSHRMQFPGINNFPIEWGNGYFITVTDNTNWTW